MFYSFDKRCSCLYYIERNFWCVLMRFISNWFCLLLTLYWEMLKQREVNLEQQRFRFLVCLNGTYVYKVNSRLETWHLHVHVIEMIFIIKLLDSFLCCKKESWVFLLITHCDVAWYILEWWLWHSFDLCNNHGRMQNNKCGDIMILNRSRILL